MRKTLIACLVISLPLLLAACANPGYSYVKQNKLLAEQGKLPWSTYYEQAYRSYETSNIAGKGALLSRINTMIMVSKTYERHEISEDQFHFIRRKLEAEQTAENQAEENARIKATLAAMREANINNAAPLYQIVQPKQLPTTTYTNCTALGNQMNCTSR